MVVDETQYEFLGVPKLSNFKTKKDTSRYRGGPEYRRERTKFYSNAIQQVVLGLAMLQNGGGDIKQCNGNHVTLYDASHTNFGLVETHDLPGGYVPHEYTVHGKTYHLPNYGFRVVIKE